MLFGNETLSMSNCSGDSNLTNGTEDDYYYYYDYDDSVNSLPLFELIPGAIIYGLTFLIGVTGNALVIFSIAKYRRMRNITNIFLLSLSTADLLLVLFCVPVKFAAFFTFTWIFGELLCKLLVYVQNLSSICSVLTLTVMSLERYYAILHPLRAKYVCSMRKAKRAIVIIWFLSVILALPIAFLQIHKEVGAVRKGYWCIKDWEDTIFSRIYEIYMFCIMLVIPLSIMMFAYSNISLELWNVSNQRITMKNGRQYLSTSAKSSPFHIGSDKSPVIRSNSTFKISSEDDKTRKQVIKMLVSVIIIFIICWAPILTTNLLTAFNILHHLNYGYLKPMRFSFYLLSYLNSCVNPIIYGFMSKSFRQTFLHAICTCIRGKAYSRRMYFLRQNSSQTRSTNYNTNSKNGDIELNRTTCDHNCAYGSCDTV